MGPRMLAEGVDGKAIQLLTAPVVCGRCRGGGRFTTAIRIHPTTRTIDAVDSLARLGGGRLAHLWWIAGTPTGPIVPWSRRHLDWLGRSGTSPRHF